MNTLSKLDDTSRDPAANNSPIKAQMVNQEKIFFDGLDCMTACSNKDKEEESDKAVYVECLDACVQRPAASTHRQSSLTREIPLTPRRSNTVSPKCHTRVLLLTLHSPPCVY
jgi:hypothetical protein